MPKPKEPVTEKLLDELITTAMSFRLSEDMELAQRIDDIKRRLLGVDKLKGKWKPTEDRR
jgi:hypothetical protein